MVLQSLRQTLRQKFIFILQRAEKRFKRWSRPTNAGLLLGTIADMTRSKSELIVENAFLRQQLIVLRRQTKRPVLTSSDRGLLVVLAGRLRTWRESLLIVKPETLLHWHRQGFRLFWRHKSKSKTRQSRIPQEVLPSYTAWHSTIACGVLNGSKMNFGSWVICSVSGQLPNTCIKPVELAHRTRMDKLGQLF